MAGYRHFALGSILLLPILGGCGKSLLYEPKEIHHLTVVTADQWATREDVTILVKRFSRHDNEYYFNTPNLRFIPIEITVNNKSIDDWVLAPEFINIEMVPMQNVISELSPSYARSIGMQMLVGPQLSSVYSLRQFDTKNRIAHDLGAKCLDQPMTVAPGEKRSAIIFVKKQHMKPRCIIDLGHADIPNKHLVFEFSCM